MAEVLEDLPQSTRDTRYPWNEWLDGRVWKLVEGQDYKSKTFPTAIYNTAKKQGKKVVVRKVEGGIAIKASPASENGVKSSRRARASASS